MVFEFSSSSVTNCQLLLSLDKDAYIIHKQIWKNYIALLNCLLISLFLYQYIASSMINEF